MRESGSAASAGRARSPQTAKMIVNCVAYANGRRLRDIDIEEISEVLEQPDTFIWLGLLEPSEELMKEVQEEFGLHDLAAEDAHRAHQRPKFEVYGDCLFVVLHTGQLAGGKVHFGETHVFVGPRYVVSVRHGASASYAPVRERCERTPGLLALGSGYVLYAIMDFVVDNYIPVVGALEDDLASLEDQIFKAAGKRKTAQRIYQLKREVMAVRRAIYPLLEVCDQLSRFTSNIIPDDTRPYYRDVHDHVVRINEAIDNVREMLTTALHVNLSLVSIGQNDVVKKLAGWGAILAVPTLVASVYGMNFQFMPELQWEFGYPAVVALTAVVCLMVFRRLKRADWL